MATRATYPVATGQFKRTIIETKIYAKGNGLRVSERKERILEIISQVIDDNLASGSHTNGKMVAAFEKRWTEVVGAADSVAVNSGSSALRGALEAQRFAPGSEVLVPSYTFIMTAYTVSDAMCLSPEGVFQKLGLTPVFVDVDPETFTLDPECARAAITDRTVAIMAVHMLGQMADMRPLRQLADAHGLILIEDAAQGHGAHYSDPLTGEVWRAGAAGHLGCFSLSDVKNIGTFGTDGGVVSITPRMLERIPSIGGRLRSWRNTGRMHNRRYTHNAWGIRARMDEYSAAECLDEIALMETWNERRRQIAARFDAALEGTGLQAPRVAPGRNHTYFGYLVKAPSVATREDFELQLQSAGIEVDQGYTVVPDQQMYRTGQLPSRVHSADVARNVAQLLTPIPCYPELSERQIQWIETLLSSFR